MSTWRDVAAVVESVAPTLGTVLGGPGGAAVGSLVAAGLGVARSPDSVIKAIEEQPLAAQKLREIEAGIEQALIQARGQVITAEAQGESWLQRNWRPLVMLWFAGLVGGYWFGFTPPYLSEATVSGLFDIVQYGLSGYIVGRSAEKITRIATGGGIFQHLGEKVRK